MSLIPQDKYAEILEVMPIYCVDMVLKNQHQEYLLIQRDNEPKKGEWWVIGGRVLKGETAKEAASRKVKQETGLEITDFKPIGFFELVNGKSAFDLPFECHTMSIVFAGDIIDNQPIILDEQSLGYKFSKELPADFNYKQF